MFTYLLIAYIIIYCVFALFLFVAYARIVPDDEKKTDKPWETPVDIRSATLKAIWQPLSIALVAAQVFLCIKDRISMFRSGEAKAGQSEVMFADISTMLFLLPAFWLNIYYAFR